MDRNNIENKNYPQTQIESDIKRIKENRAKASRSIILKYIGFLRLAFVKERKKRGQILIFLSLIALLFICFVSYIWFFVPFLVKITAVRLGLPIWLSIFIICVCSTSLVKLSFYKPKRYGLDIFNIPLYIIYLQEERKKLAFYPMWLFKKHRTSWSLNSLKRQEINLVGGIIPIALACWQFTRVSITSIAIITAVVIPFFYFWVKITPGISISISQLKSCAIVVLTAILAFSIGKKDDVGAIAYASITLGCLIGADLLHLKDVKLEQALKNLSIGGAGWQDGIVQSGFSALLLTELIFKIKFL